MPTLCPSPIKGLVYRLVKLDSCGDPITGAGSVVVSKFVKVTSTFEYEDGTEFLVKAADGTPCINQKDDPFLKRVTAAIDLCNIDPDGVVIVTGETLITSGDPATGTGVAFSDDASTARFSLEVWQAVAGAGACDASGDPQYLYWAYPNLGGAKVSDYTVELGPSQLSLTADSRIGRATWVDAVNSIWVPAGFSVIGKHYLFNVTTEPPPEPTCGATALS